MPDDALLSPDIDLFPAENLEAVSPTFPDQGTTNPRAPALHKDPAAAAIQITRDNYEWNPAPGSPANITYAFRASGPTYLILGSRVASTFLSFNATQIAATEAILALWSDVANISFTRIGYGTSPSTAFSNDATILLGNYRDASDGAAAFTYLANPLGTATTSAAGDVWDNQYWTYNAGPSIGNYGWLTLIHELGHAIGLEHPSDYNILTSTSITYENNATYFEDSRQYTDMSYFSASNTGANHGTYYAATPLLDDITAVQRLYGANPNTRTGNTTYGFNSNADRDVYKLTSAADQRVETIYDAGGIDTLDLSGYATNQLINLTPGAFSSTGALTGNLSIAQGTIIENAIGGSGNDTFYGNAADNIFDGRAGTDKVVYSGKRAEYAVRREGTALILTDAVPNRDGTDRLFNIETVQFSDITVATTLIDAPTFVITATDARRPEGNTGTVPLTFTVTRSIELSQPVTLSWQVAGNGTNPATASDFQNATFPTGTLAFAPGETTKTITVNAVGDRTPEPDETFLLTLSGPTSIALPTPFAQGTILDDDTPAIIGWNEATTQASGSQVMDPADPAGPDYLVWQYIYAGTASRAVSTSAPNTFIHTGSGNDAIQSGNGSNVLDGGLGSNFMTGGTGTDTFFTDARAPGIVWNTIRNFGTGDSATLWGFVPGISSYSWDNAISGAPGFQGATLRANIVGGNGRTGNGIDASITFTGLSVIQAQNLQIATGTQPAGSYLFLYNPGV